MDIYKCLENNEYEIKRLLSSGSYGDCWFVRKNGKSRILKIYKSNSSDECYYEMSVYKDLHGEGLGVDWLFKAERLDFSDFSVLELDTYEGMTLEELFFHSNKKYSLIEKLQFLIDACKTILQMHNSEKSYVHLDIKPSNFYVSDNGQVKPIDLGSAVSLKDHTKGDKDACFEKVINSLGYMSTKEYASRLVRIFNKRRIEFANMEGVTDDEKNQLLDLSHKIGIKDDIYSLICCVFDVLTNGRYIGFWLENDSECCDISKLLREILIENDIPSYLIPDLEKLFMELDGPNQYLSKEVGIKSVEELIIILEDIQKTEKAEGVSIGVLRRCSMEYFNEHFSDEKIDEELLTEVEEM